MKTGPEVWGKGWGWCRRKVALAVPRGPLQCAAQSRAVAEGGGGEETRRHVPLHSLGSATPKGRLGWSAGSQPPWDSQGDVPLRWDFAVKGRALVWGYRAGAELGEPPSLTGLSGEAVLSTGNAWCVLRP